MFFPFFLPRNTGPHPYSSIAACEMQFQQFAIEFTNFQSRLEEFMKLKTVTNTRDT